MITDKIDYGRAIYLYMLSCCLFFLTAYVIKLFVPFCPPNDLGVRYPNSQ